MNSHNSNKEKIIALLTVILLFLIVGGLFFSISLDNRRKTEALRLEVQRIKKEAEITKKLASINLDKTYLNNLTSKAYSSVILAENNRTKILAEKNPNLTLPIASLTKLMVAVIILENTDPKTTVIATSDYIGQEESYFVLETDRRYKINDLLVNALIASDNDSARLLASVLGTENFINKMNSKAKELGLTQTYFVNVTGLDPHDISANLNISTVNDLAQLLIYIRNKHPQILRITSESQYNFCDLNNYCKLITSTDKLLNEKTLQFKIIGGKTGTTDLAGKNLALLTEIYPDLFLLNIVMGSENSFADSATIINNIKIEN